MSDKSRRSILRGIGAASAATVSTSIVSAGQQQLSNVDQESKEKLKKVLSNVTELTGDQKETLIEKAKEKSEFDVLLKSIESYNKRVEEDSIVAYDSKELGHYFVVFKYKIYNNFGEEEDGELLISIEKSDEKATIEFDGALGPRAVVQKPKQKVSLYKKSDTPAESIGKFNDVSRSSIEINDSSVEKYTLRSSQNIVQPMGGGWGCAACKDMVGLVVNTVTCSLEAVVACAVITSKTAVGPVACPVAFGVICTIIYNEGINDPDNVCGGCDMWGTEIIEAAPCSDCDDCSWYNPLC